VPSGYVDAHITIAYVTAAMMSVSVTTFISENVAISMKLRPQIIPVPKTAESIMFIAKSTRGSPSERVSIREA
jgi:hypothetical protein